MQADPNAAAAAAAAAAKAAAAAETPAETLTAVIVVVAIILVMGAVGGLTAWLAQKPQPGADPPPAPGPSWPTFIALGLVASACVPLFLSILQSGMLKAIFTTPLGPDSFVNYLVFAGLCLVAAVSARRFIDTLTEQLLRKVDQAQSEALKAKVAADQAKDAARGAIDEIEKADEVTARSGPEPLLGPEAAELTESERQEARDEPLSPTEQKILRAMLTRPYRTATGIAQDAGVSRAQISEFLDGLAHRNLVTPTRSPSTGGARWAISRRGIAALGEGA